MKELFPLKRIFLFLLYVLKYTIMIILIGAAIQARQEIMKNQPFKINFEYRVY